MPYNPLQDGKHRLLGRFKLTMIICRLERDDSSNITISNTPIQASLSYLIHGM
jgi:hypothetical protein